MGDVVSFPISLESDLGRELIVDCARFAEGLLDERAVRKKYRFDEAPGRPLGATTSWSRKSKPRNYAGSGTAPASESARSNSS